MMLKRLKICLILIVSITAFGQEKKQDTTNTHCERKAIVQTTDTIMVDLKTILKLLNDTIK